MNLIIILIWLNKIDVWSNWEPLRINYFLVMKVRIIAIINRHMIFTMIDFTVISIRFNLFLTYDRFRCLNNSSHGGWRPLISWIKLLKIYRMWDTFYIWLCFYHLVSFCNIHRASGRYWIAIFHRFSDILNPLCKLWMIHCIVVVSLLERRRHTRVTPFRWTLKLENYLWQLSVDSHLILLYKMLTILVRMSTCLFGTERWWLHHVH